MKILVVDDERDIQLLFEQRFRIAPQKRFPSAFSCSQVGQRMRALRDQCTPGARDPDSGEQTIQGPPASDNRGAEDSLSFYAASGSLKPATRLNGIVQPPISTVSPVTRPASSRSNV